VIDRAEETLGVDLHLRLSTALAVMHGRTPDTNASVGGHGLMWLGDFFPQRADQCSRDARSQINLVENITVALKQLDLLSAQGENLIAVSGLQESHQGFEVKTLGDNGQFGDLSLELVHPKQPLCTQHGQAVKGMGPEVAVASQDQERFQQWPYLTLVELLQERRLQLLHKVPKSDGILLILRVVSMCCLIKRKARRITAVQKPICQVLVTPVHNPTPE